jgi:two-component system, OmpR family, response regulator
VGLVARQTLASNRAHAPTGDRRVLIVDDDDAIRQLVSLALTDEGYLIREAAGGPEALALAREWRPDLIVLDVRLPGMDGWSFLAEHRRDGLADIPVLVLTADSHAEGEAAALDVPVLPKPFDLDEFLDRVDRLTRRHTPEADGSRMGPPIAP